MATTTLFTISAASEQESASAKKTTQLASLNPQQCPLSIADMLTQIKRLEKRTFPKDEALDFDAELKKRNTELIVILDTSPPSEAVEFTISEANRQPVRSLLIDHAENSTTSSENPEPTEHEAYSSLVVAYALQARSGGVSLLHKVCVAEKYRRKGIALNLLSKLKTRLEGQGCERIQLWVDWRRDAAIELYKAAGFRRIDGARDYYGPGRHGVKMAVDLTWIW